MPTEPVESREPAELDLLPDFPGRASRSSLRDRLEGWAETLDLSLPRLLVGAVVVAVLGVAGWRLLAPPSPPPEMTLPMTSGGQGAEVAGPSSGPEATVTSPGAGSTAAGSGDSSGSSPSKVVVHVEGAVHEPGVQRLQASARVIDAVDAAGGTTPDADLARVNLAAPLEDGQQVYIPRAGEDPPPLATSPAGPTAGGDTAGSAGRSGDDPSTRLVNINTAGTDELQTLHGIGPAIAQAIVDHRDKRGPFTSVEQLTDVRGIGEAKLEGLRDQVTV